jgi:hypothetical protein
LIQQNFIFETAKALKLMMCTLKTFHYIQAASWKLSLFEKRFYFNFCHLVNFFSKLIFIQIFFHDWGWQDLNLDTLCSSNDLGTVGTEAEGCRTIFCPYFINYISKMVEDMC